MTAPKSSASASSRGGPRIGIVVPTKDPAAEPARRCLAAVAATTAHLNVSVHPVVSSGPGFRLARSVNRGIAMAPDADFWVLLNDDCFMDEGWLDRMLEAARAHPAVGIVGAVLRYPDGRIQHAGGYVPRTVPYLLHMAFQKRAPLWPLRRMASGQGGSSLFCVHHRRVSPRHRLDFVTGACVLVTRVCWERIGGYDERFEFSFEDVDHSLRALEVGFEVALASDARGVHLERASGGGLKEAIRRSASAFDVRWPREQVLKLTRRGGRRGIHQGAQG